MKVDRDEIFNVIIVKREADDIPISYERSELHADKNAVVPAIPTTTTVTEEEFFHIHGYIFETSLKIEATRLQNQNHVSNVEQQVEEEQMLNCISDDIQMMFAKDPVVKVKRLSNQKLTEFLCPKKLKVTLSKFSSDGFKNVSTKLNSLTKSTNASTIAKSKKFTCDICRKNFPTKSRLKEHIFGVHHTQMSYQCSVCPKGYLSKPALQHHERIHLTRECDFECHICSKSYSHVGALKQHLQAHLGEKTLNSKKRKCHFCKMRFYTTQELVVHRKTHTDISIYQCKMCPMNFTTKSALLQHNRDHRDNAKIMTPFECYLCKKKFVLVHSLQNHMRIHTMKYDCRICMREFNQEAELDTHLLTHSGKYRFECSVCSQGFAWKTSFSRHIRIHTSERPFQCDRCQKTFKEKDYLIAHKRTHIGRDEKTVDRTKFTWRFTNEKKMRQSKTYVRGDGNGRGLKKEFKCKICMTIIKNENELDSHFDGHTGNTLFECSICKQGFDYGPNMYRHMRQRHTTAKPYKCDRCPNEYRDSTSLKVHIRCHNGEKAECEICLRKFSDKGYLRLHRRQHTGEYPFECLLCKMKFRVQQSFKLHACFQCEICSRYFNKMNMRVHMRDHLQMGQNVCNTKRA